VQRVIKGYKELTKQAKGGNKCGKTVKGAHALPSARVRGARVDREDEKRASVSVWRDTNTKQIHQSKSQNVPSC